MAAPRRRRPSLTQPATSDTLPGACGSVLAVLVAVAAAWALLAAGGENSTPTTSIWSVALQRLGLLGSDGGAPSEPLLPQYGGLATVPVKRVEWGDVVAAGPGALRGLFDGPNARPVIVVNGPNTLWPASAWTERALAGSGAVFPSVRASRQPRFRYWDGTKPLAADAAAAADRDGVGQYGNERFNVSASSLFETLLPELAAERVARELLQGADGGNSDTESSAATAEAYAYVSADLDLPQLAALRRDVRPTSPLHVYPDAPASSHRRFVWVGTANATAPFHYDTSHNLYAQVIGAKRFYMVPPSEHAGMHVFPVSHPGDRQSQVPWHASPRWVLSDLGRFHMWHGMEGSVHVADVRPGELLAMPAMWFHCVEARSELSVSVNLWQLSEDSAALETLLADAVPMWQKSWPPAKTLLVVQRYVTAVLTVALAATGDADSDVTSSTGGGRGGRGGGAGQDACAGEPPGPACADGLVREALETQFAPLGMWDPGATAAFSCSTAAGRGLEAALAPHVERAAHTFAAMAPAVRRVLAGVWVQHLAGFAAIQAGRSHRDAPGFLADCVCSDCRKPI